MKEEWFKLGEWTDIPLLAIDIWNGKSANLTQKQIFGDYLRIVFFWKSNKQELMFAEKKDEQRIANIAREHYQKDPKYFHNILEEYRRHREEKLARSLEIGKSDFSLITKIELSVLLSEGSKIIGYSGAHDWIAFSIDNTMLDVVGLTDYLNNNPAKKEQILSLATPVSALATFAEEVRILKIALKAKGLDKEGILENFEEEIDKLQEDFGYIGALIYYPPTSKESYAEQVLNRSKEENLQEKLKQKERNEEELKEQLEIVSKSVPEHIVSAIEALQALSELRGIGGLDSLHHFYNLRPLFKEIKERLKLSEEDFWLLRLNEVTAALCGEQIPDLKERKKLYGIKRVENGEMEELPNPQAFLDVISEKKTVELRGMPCYPGIVKGKAVVIESTIDMKRFERGDILVARATCVDYVPIMKKAAAVVTEFGGITSHAAVVSRELQVPTIVGVAGLTSKVKEGNIVEVDAKNGQVRII